jgi:hypothetical protein
MNALAVYLEIKTISHMKIIVEFESERCGPHLRYTVCCRHRDRDPPDT